MCTVFLALLYFSFLFSHRISDVFLGRQSSELKSELASSELNSRCFSIVTKERALHLVAEDEATRAEWLAR